MRFTARRNAKSLTVLPFELVRNVRIAFAQVIAAQTHEALDGINRPPRLERARSRRRLSYERSSVRREVDDGWRQPLAILVRDQDGKPGVHHADERVGRSKIDADNFIHTKSL